MKYKINFEEIKRIAADFIRSIKQMAKEAINLPYARWYVALAFFLTIIFFLITFPYGVLVKKQLMKMEGRTFRSINITSLDFNIIGLTTVNDAALVSRAGDEISVQEIQLEANKVPVLLGILMKKNTRIKGSLGMKGFRYSGRTFDLTMNMSSNINMVFDLKSKSPSDGELKFVIQDCKINTDEIQLPPNFGGLSLDIPRLKFTSINLNAVVTGRKCTLRNTLFSGPDLRGRITGNIALDRNINNSRLNLEISINSNSSVLNPYRELLTKFIDNDNMIRLPLKGTLSRPQLDFSAFSSPETTM